MDSRMQSIGGAVFPTQTAPVIEEERREDRRVSELARSAEDITKEVYGVVSRVNGAIKALRSARGVRTGFIAANLVSDIKELGLGGRGASKRIWSLLVTVTSISVLEVANSIAENLPAAVPVVNGLGVGIGCISVVVALDAVLRARNLLRSLNELHENVCKTPGVEKAQLLLAGLKKLKVDGIGSMQDRLLFSKGADLAKRVDDAISRLTLCQSPQPLEGDERMVRILALRASVSLGSVLATVALRIMAVVGMGLLAFSVGALAGAVGAILLATSSGISFVLFAGKFMCINPNPFDPECRSRAHELGTALRLSCVAFLQRWHLISADPAVGIPSR